MALSRYYEVARHCRLDPCAMLGRAGIHPGALKDPENWISARKFLNLLEDCAHQSGRDDFSVLLGETRSFSSLGPVSLLLRHELTLGRTIDGMIEYRRLINELLQFDLRTQNSIAILEWTLIPGLRSVQATNLLAAVAYRILVDGGGFDWQPECLHFRHAPPGRVETFKRVFRCTLEFESDFDGISFASASLEIPNRFADEGLTVHARRLLNLLPAMQVEESMASRVRSLIPIMLGGTQGGGADVAERLGVSLRTLQRRLSEENQTFSGLLNEVRRELAIRFLANSRQSITDITLSLGFSDPSSFTRWFIAEFKQAPSKWRARMRTRDVVTGIVSERASDHAGLQGTS